MCKSKHVRQNYKVLIGVKVTTITTAKFKIVFLSINTYLLVI